MLIVHKKAFVKGLLMAISFFVSLAVMFSPLFGGENAFKAADRLFNSIAKGSTHYIPDLLKRSETYRGQAFDVTLETGSEKLTAEGEKVLAAAGALVVRGDGKLKVQGDLAGVVEAALRDAESMFFNRGQEIAAKYGFPEKEVLFAWWKALGGIEKGLKEQKKFKAAAFLAEVMAKGVEVGYNFYGIEPEKASDKSWILSFSLVFYVFYTLWWGYAIYFLFEGLGLEMKSGAKKEV
jgi:hypothetical protein